MKIPKQFRRSERNFAGCGVSLDTVFNADVGLI